MTFNFNPITLDKSKTSSEKNTKNNKWSDFYYFISFYPSSILSILFLELRCLSGSNGNLPHSDEVVSVASKQCLRKNKYETLCLIQVLKSLPGCCIYTSHPTAHWLKRQVSYTQAHTQQTEAVCSLTCPSADQASEVHCGGSALLLVLITSCLSSSTMILPSRSCRESSRTNRCQGGMERHLQTISIDK